ncbi:uncharacterized protein BKA55DRAFT_584679 [Fusarium redolens]|uniref:Uncharacterized protein n=1 Tax=Fusarium redolens TaxID=48865 RepID=A0A9P9FZ73_FUSRE|nr:uncharacterized protein BKA55DRAFT_584679 [Fusarium redolens]KAH7222548.1 hypothetical protein BKA55DRAFT_584679 [Fusarium redolens]
MLSFDDTQMSLAQEELTRFGTTNGFSQPSSTVMIVPYSHIATSKGRTLWYRTMFIPINFTVTYGGHVGLSNKMAGYLVSISNASR